MLREPQRTAPCAPSRPERKPHGRPRSPSSAAACEGGEVAEAPGGRQPHLVLFGLDFCADLGDRLSGQCDSSTRREKKKTKEILGKPILEVARGQMI